MGNLWHHHTKAHAITAVAAPLQAITSVIALVFGWSIRNYEGTVIGALVVIGFACMAVAVGCAGRPAVRAGFVVLMLWYCVNVGCTAMMLLWMSALTCTSSSHDLLCSFDALLWTVGKGWPIIASCMLVLRQLPRADRANPDLIARSIGAA